ncbi:hypothetical protein [Longimicrobium sp.]|uniref:hypothetical protein n=1 Tax=Longimicrobium sp. TaxID=2029185 RepID=UPI002BA369D1|nr:hypothetical protein [Longimicrobium sp.]HSU12501.1 hypothetical protein [Longimicrobium sp.]
MKRAPILRRCAFALGVLGSLTFGAAQAFGSAPTPRDASRPWCDPVQCNVKCGGYGICQNNVCLCY